MAGPPSGDAEERRLCLRPAGKLAGIYFDGGRDWGLSAGQAGKSMERVRAPEALPLRLEAAEEAARLPALLCPLSVFTAAAAA